MMANVGGADRVVRAVLGLILVAAPFLPIASSFLDDWGAWAYLVPVVGLVMLGTAAFRFCPLYPLFGMNTCPLERR